MDLIRKIEVLKKIEKRSVEQNELLGSMIYELNANMNTIVRLYDEYDVKD